MKPTYLKYICQTLLIVGSIPIGALMIVPALSVYSQEKPKNLALYSILLYFIASVVLTSFNLLIFLALLSTLIYIKYRNVGSLGLTASLAALSAFIQTLVFYPLLSAFFIGLALFAIMDADIIDMFFRREKRKVRIYKDDVIAQLDLAEEHILKQMRK